MKRALSRQASRPGSVYRQRKVDPPLQSEMDAEPEYLGDPDPRDKILRKPSLDDHTRQWMAKFLIICIVLALGTGAVVGVYQRSWAAINAVWFGVAPLVGMIVGYYFGAKKKAD